MALSNPRPVLLVLRALGLGDFLTGLPALRALADAFPNHRRVLAMPPALEPLARVTGVVHEVLPAHGLQPIEGRMASPDVAVNLHGRGPKSHRVLTALTPRRLIAFAHPAVPETADFPEWRAGEHEVLRWCRLLEESFIPASPTRLDLDLPAPQHGATVIHPGASSGARRWPPERWAAVARHERLEGREVLVTGGPDEASLAATVAAMAGLPRVASLAGRTSVSELAATVAGAGLVVCGDTGVAHLASAARTPSVVLFGPTPPSEWGPPPRAIHKVLWTGEVGDPHGDQPTSGLLAISVDAVLTAIADVRSAAVPAT